MGVISQDLQEQRFRALGTANTVRMQNATLRFQVKRLSFVDGLRAVADILTSADQPAIPIGRLLRSVRAVGHVKAAEWCSHPKVACSQERLVKDMTVRQRLALAARLETHAARREAEIGRAGK